MKWTLIILFGVISPFSSFSQVQDSIELKSVIISAEKPSGIPALKSRELDSTVLQITQNQNIGTILQNHSSITIKTYGVNGIQTPTFRGMSASHTKVYVNGLDMSPASLGQNDLSIIPGFLFSGVAIKYGNAAFTEGTGAIGGGVMLSTNSSKLKSGSSLIAGLSIGSFGKKVGTFQYGYKFKKLESITRYIYQDATNNFEYRNIAQPNSPTVKQEHSEGTLHGFSQTLNYQLNTTNQLSALLLGSFSNRNLPALMTDVKKSEQAQEDQTINTQWGWKHYGSNSVSNLVIGYNWSSLNYVDPAANIDSKTLNSRFQLREDYTLNLNTNWALKSTTVFSYSTVANAAYFGGDHQFQGSVLLGANGHLYKKWEVGVFIQPTVNNSDFVLLPMASIAFLPTGKQNVIVGANIAQNAHYPTLNDLYWTPGGNLDLQPEMATNAELNLHVDGVIMRSLFWDFDLAGFYGSVDNWILWKPTDKSYWEAQNIKTVVHSGAEAFVGLHKVWENWGINFKGSYQFVQAINKDVEDASLNKQLIYTPEHSANWLVGIKYHNLGLNLNYDFTGIRYITTDNTSYLPAYDLVNLTATYPIKLKDKHTFDIQFDVFNVLNKEYMSVTWRAMPGTNYLVSVKYNLN